MELATEKSRWVYISKKDYALAQEISKTGDDALRKPKYAIYGKQTPAYVAPARFQKAV